MTLSLGVSTNAPFAGSTTGTTTGIATQATGSGFVVDVVWVGTATPPGVTDNKSNGSYPQLGTTIAIGPDFFLARFEVLNGLGGTGHTYTATFGASTDFTVLVTEIKTTVGNGVVVDQSPAPNATATSPYTSNSATTTVAAEFALAVCAPLAFPGNDTVSWQNSFLAIEDQVDTNLVSAHTGYRLLSATGTYAAAFVATGAPTFNSMFQFTTYYEAAAGGVSTNSLFFGAGSTG